MLEDQPDSLPTLREEPGRSSMTSQPVSVHVLSGVRPGLAVYWCGALAAVMSHDAEVEGGPWVLEAGFGPWDRWPLGESFQDAAAAMRWVEAKAGG